MQEKQSADLRFVHGKLPWLIAGGALVLYLVTLNRWVSLESLPFAAEVSGWDWSLPQQAPLFFVLTAPIRLLPDTWQPVMLNAFAALCGAATLGLLARSVALLPHDRTHDQRLRERHENAFLSLGTAWLPPLFAALLCGLQLTFWEHSTAFTNEMLDLLVFAYVIRALLEFRIDRRPSWLIKLSFLYGLGVTNNAAMIGFAPLFFAATAWIMGRDLLNLRLAGAMFLAGVAGLLLYLVLPIAWVMSGHDVSFWLALKANWVQQKTFLLGIPALRNRALLLSLTAILPVILIGIRWKSNTGETSAAGNLASTLMFRVVHLVLLAACVWVAFDQQFSPRALAFGFPFLTFYYLGALSAGYLSGYALLVFRAPRAKGWRKPGAATLWFHRLIRGAVYAAVIAVPIALFAKNFGAVRSNDGRLLNQLAAHQAERLPESNSVVVSDDVRALLLLRGWLATHSQHEHLLLASAALPLPIYQEHLEREFPEQWSALESPSDSEQIPDSAIQERLASLAAERPVFYMHPSFGYFFERTYARPNGLLFRLVPYPASAPFPPPLDEALIAENAAYWKSLIPSLPSPDSESSAVRFATQTYSRALNEWGVHLQRAGRLERAAETFRAALAQNTNNVAAQVNLAANESLRQDGKVALRAAAEIEEEFNFSINRDTLLLSHGQFDDPAFRALLGRHFFSGSLWRQSASEFSRAAELAPEAINPKLGLAHALAGGGFFEPALERVAELRQSPGLDITNKIELVQIKAAILFSQGAAEEAEKTLLQAAQELDHHPRITDTLLQFYHASGRASDSVSLLAAQLSIRPNEPSLLFKKAEAHLTMGEYDQALAILEALLERQPENTGVLFFKGLVHFRNKDYQLAEEVFDKVIQKDPSHLEALLSKGAVLLESKRYAEAIETMNQMLERRPKNWAAIKNRAIAHLQLGQLKEAKEDYEALLKLVPRFHSAHYGLAEIAMRQSNAREAIEHYELYLKTLPPSQSPELKAEAAEVKEKLAQLKAGAG